MGKSQSKLSADELAELQKNTYCEYTHACARSASVIPAISRTVELTTVDKKVSLRSMPPRLGGSTLSTHDH